MKIWVDADACPVVIKDILFRAAKRTQIQTILVANSPIQIPKSDFISMLQVGAGFDVADNEIVAQMNAGDLVITSDIPLAADVIEKGGFALSTRGEMFSSDNIKARLSIRDYMDELRQSGIHSGGQAAFSQTDRQNFANKLDQLMTKYLKSL
ncbi:MAG: YaiI/YqxD family protein [Ghiorsea sp.]